MDARSKEARRVVTSIGTILLRGWDPLGLKDVSGAAGEYDAYVGGVYRLLASGTSVDDIARHLQDIEIHELGLARVPGRLERLRTVAEALLALDVELREVGDFAGMTVNERLYEAGLLDDFDQATRDRDRATMVSLLVKTALPRDSAEQTVEAILRMRASGGHPGPR